MKERDAKLSQLAKCWKRYPQLVTNVRVREKKPFEQLDGVLGLVKQAEAAVAPGGGRLLLRYSGTEPKARLLIEGPDKAVLERWSQSICDAIKKQVGA
jgi:phosphoglucosamine mutase